MNNKVIYLTNTHERRNNARHYSNSRKICSLFVLFADAVATLSISVCTIFCMYLAYTML